MEIYSLLSLCIQAENMRNAQKQYFILIAKAKNTKNPDDYKAAKHMLELSKQLEKSFDGSLSFIRAQEQINMAEMEGEV